MILQEKRQKNERTISFYPYFMRKYATFGGRAIHSEMDLCALIRPFETALRRFKRTIEKSGLLTELRAREFYEKPTAERKRKKAAAIKRHYKRLRSQMLPKKLY